MIFTWQLAGIHLFRRVKAFDKDYFYFLLVGVVLLSFGFSDLVRANGMLSAFFAGYIMGNDSFPFKRNISTFLDALAILANTIIFVLLGLLVFPSHLGDIWLQGILLFLDFLKLSIMVKPDQKTSSEILGQFSKKV